MITRLATAVALLAAVASGQAAAQSYVAADCAITYRNDNAYQGQLLARVGVTPLVPWDSKNYTWTMGIAFTVPAGKYSSAKVVLPTLNTGNSYGYAPSGTVYLTLVQGYDGVNTCAGYGPGFALTGKPKADNDLVTLAGTYSVTIPTGGIVMKLNAKTLALLNAHAGNADGVVFGVSMLVPRIPVFKDGEWTKGNQPGTVVDFNRESACNGTSSAYCPSLVLQ